MLYLGGAAAVLNFSSNMLMWDMIHVGYGHIALGPTDFLSGRLESCVTPPSPPLHPSQDEYSISSVYTADPVGDVGLETSRRTNNS